MTSVSASTIKLVTHVKSGVGIDWGDGHHSDFPYRWLRYECTCEVCGESRTGIRFITLADIPNDLEIVACSRDDSGALSVRWGPDSHSSRYDPEWLRQHDLEETGGVSKSHTPTTWGAELIDALPSVQFDEFVGDRARRCDALEAIRDFGIVRVTDGPTKLGVVEHLASHLGPLEETNFGRIFELKTADHARAIGATRYPATLHTDECYRNMPTGIKCIHCIQDSDTGTGYSLFADAFQIGKQLKQASPAAFELLCTVPITFNRRYDDAIIVATACIFSRDAGGQLRGFRFQDRSMAPLRMAPAQVDDIFDAIAQLMRLIGDPANQLRLRLRPGEAVLFDNHRLLHGRTGFTGARHLQLCSVNRDTYLSEMRVLQRDLGRPGPYMTLAGGAFA